MDELTIWLLAHSTTLSTVCPLLLTLTLPPRPALPKSRLADARSAGAAHVRPRRGRAKKAELKRMFPDESNECMKRCRGEKLSLEE